MDEIIKYFPGLTESQTERFAALGDLYREWNSKINVISRRDIDNLYVHHVLHSLAVAKFFTPDAGTTFMDLGAGGGFPGIPLAIMWPDCKFHLVDRIAKKIKVAQSVAQSIGLTNVTYQHGDALECKSKFDYIVSRAVMTLPELVKISRRLIDHRPLNTIPHGLLCLKGGDLSAEISAAKAPVLEIPLSDWFAEDFFVTKQLIYAKL